MCAVLLGQRNLFALLSVGRAVHTFGRVTNCVIQGFSCVLVPRYRNMVPDFRSAKYYSRCVAVLQVHSVSKLLAPSMQVEFTLPKI